MNTALTLLKDAKFLGALRHLLSTVGGVMAANGVIGQSDWELYTGLGMAILAVVLSAVAPEKKTTK